MIRQICRNFLLKHRPAPSLPSLEELPPAGFDVEFNYISGVRDLTKYDVWLSIVWYLTSMAVNPWNLLLPRDIHFPRCYNVDFYTRSTLTPPPCLAKHLIWTLRAAFNQYRSRGLYSSASFVTRVNGKILSFTTLKSALSLPRPGEQQAESSIPSLSPPVGRRGLDIRLSYLPNGASFSDVGFFQILIELLIWCANHDPKTSAPGTVSGYNVADNYTFTIEPVHPESQSDLPLLIVIEVLGRLPGKMVEEGRGGRWTELKAQIKMDGVNIGKISILKGLPKSLVGEACVNSNTTTTSSSQPARPESP
ncbi:MAG: hypothetical protein Q9223_003107 [Gallowayella weberi]